MSQNMFRVTYDALSNTVSVQACKADLDDIEVRSLTFGIRWTGRGDSQVRVFRLKDGFAADVAQISSARAEPNVLPPLASGTFGSNST